MQFTQNINNGRYCKIIYIPSYLVTNDLHTKCKQRKCAIHTKGSLSQCCNYHKVIAGPGPLMPVKNSVSTSASMTKNIKYCHMVSVQPKSFKKIVCIPRKKKKKKTLIVWSCRGPSGVRTVSLLLTECHDGIIQVTECDQNIIDGCRHLMLTQEKCPVLSRYTW